MPVETDLFESLDELFGADTPPERAAAVWLDRLDGDPVPVKVSRMFAVAASAEHAKPCPRHRSPRPAERGRADACRRHRLPARRVMRAQRRR